MKPGTHLNKHLFRMRAMAKLIGFSGVEIPEALQALAVLNSLPEYCEDYIEKTMMEFHASKEELIFDNVSKRLRVAHEFRQWRKYCNSDMEGGGTQGVKEKTSTSNGDKTSSFHFQYNVTEEIYSQLKTRDGQMNYTGSCFRVWKDKIHSVLHHNRVAYLLKDHDSHSEENVSSRSKRLSDEFIARHIILGGMSDDLFLTFHDYPTTRALMDALETWFGSPSVAKLMVMFDKYTKCQMSENVPLDKHLSDMDMLVSNLASVGVEIPDEMQAPRLIESLPDSWSDIQTVLRTRIEVKTDGDAEQLKLVDRVKQGARKVGSMRKVFKPKEDVEPRFTKRSQGNCFSCGRSGHYKSNCPYI